MINYNEFMEFLKLKYPHTIAGGFTNIKKHKDEPIVVQNAEALLLEFINIISTLNINYRIIFGTLLGIYRNGTLIPHDTDIDIAFNYKDLDKIKTLIPVLIDNGFYFERYLHPTLISFSKNNEYIDLYFFGGPAESETLKCVGYKLDAEDFTCDNTIDFKGLKLKTIKNPEQFFITYYGQDWKTPVKNLHADPNNINRM